MIIESEISDEHIQQPAEELRSAAEIALARHLSHAGPLVSAMLKKDAEEAEETEKTEEINNSSIDMPETVAEALEAIRTANLQVPKDKFEDLVKTVRVERLVAHLHKLSQGLPPLTIDYSKSLCPVEPTAEAKAHIMEYYKLQS